jgi:hypothetical protein
MYEGLTLQFDSRKGTKNNKMKRFHPLKTKNESLCMGFAKKYRMQHHIASLFGFSS